MSAPGVRIRGVTPYLYYEDAASALDWLSRVFGFVEDVRYLDGEGVVQEAEMLAGSTRIMIGGRAPGPEDGPGQLLIVHVDDVGAQHARVRAAGINAPEPVDMAYGPRTFCVRDPWGYRWDFWQMVRDEVELPAGWREVRPA